MTTQPGAKDMQHLAELISEIKIAMMTTIEDDGSLRSRPMMTQNTPVNGSLWFFTGEHSQKIHELQHDRHVCLTYTDPGRDRYVSIAGTGRMVRDREKAKQLWDPTYRAWFPKGLDDPELALMEVVVRKGEYWDSQRGKMVSVKGFESAPNSSVAQAPATVH